MLLGAIVLGCSKGNDHDLVELSVDSSSFLDDGEVHIGVVSDIEGAVENAKISAEKLRKENVDAVIIAGDCYENEKIRRNPLYPNSTNNLEEMVEGIRPYAELGVPVFVIPGNHESQVVYHHAMNKLKREYPRVFDIRNASVDLEGVNIVGLGGYHDKRFTDPNGFILTPDDYKTAIDMLFSFQDQDELTLFVTHSPPKSKSKIDYVPEAGHVGDENIKDIMNIDFEEKVNNIHGHIHEGGGNIDHFGYKAGMAINVSSITDYNNPDAPNTGLVSYFQSTWSGYRYINLE